MFVLRTVFERIGYFDEALGSGTKFPSEDIELATRASLAGFTGILLPSVIIYHHHGRKPGSLEAVRTLEGYDTGRGAYYAALLSRGVIGAWQLWAQCTPKGPVSPLIAARLERELRGAADYLRSMRTPQRGS